MNMDIHEIMNHLPHRYPFLMIDRVLSFERGKELQALKNVTINEQFFPGHYPHHPVMPGVLIVEAMAQAAALLLSYGISDDDRPSKDAVYYFVGIDEVRFKRPVVPGDQLILTASLLRGARGLWKFTTTAKVDGQIASEGILMCTVRNKE
jgi:3-hydroxyacyl-[acyl-carrier-protein] dehydratase